MQNCVSPPSLLSLSSCSIASVPVVPAWHPCPAFHLRGRPLTVPRNLRGWREEQVCWRTAREILWQRRCMNPAIYILHLVRGKHRRFLLEVCQRCIRHGRRCAVVPAEAPIDAPRREDAPAYDDKRNKGNACADYNEDEIFWQIVSLEVRCTD